jgi:hypothetical protein
MLRSVDNKDRWIVRVDRDTAALATVHRLTDAAWINWNFNDFGVLPDGRAWWLSEESGYSHLYVQDGRRAKALTSGRWEASSPVLTADAASFVFVCNREWPGDYELCRVPVAGGDVRELTALDGVEDFTLSPDGSKIALRWSASFTPPQAAVVGIEGGAVTKLTDTRTAAFKAMPWRARAGGNAAGVSWAHVVPFHDQKSLRAVPVAFSPPKRRPRLALRSNAMRWPLRAGGAVGVEMRFHWLLAHVHVSASGVPSGFLPPKSRLFWRAGSRSSECSVRGTGLNGGNCVVQVVPVSV